MLLPQRNEVETMVSVLWSVCPKPCRFGQSNNIFSIFIYLYKYIFVQINTAENLPSVFTPSIQQEHVVWPTSVGAHSTHHCPTLARIGTASPLITTPFNRQAGRV